MSKNLTSVTRIRMVVEIHGSSYGPEWKVGDIIEQAKREGPDHLRCMMKNGSVHIVGEPVVTVVTVTEEKS